MNQDKQSEVIEREARFYIDCEFDGHGGPLLSIAMVREDGLSIHIRTTERANDPWVVQNVVPLLDMHAADVDGVVSVAGVGGALRYFIGTCEHPTIVADSPVDIGRFCAAISTGDDGGWAPADYPAMTFEVHNVDCYPTDLPGAVQHNAWWDAMALRHILSRPSLSTPSEGAVAVPRELFDFLMGQGEIDGTSFGDMHEGLPGRFWWRALLQTCENSTPSEGVIDALEAARSYIRSPIRMSTDEGEQVRRDRIVQQITESLARLSPLPLVEEGAKTPDSYAEWQQRRGMAADVFDWAILEYDEYMKDDDDDAQAVLDRIVARLRDVRETLLAPLPTASLIRDSFDPDGDNDGGELMVLPPASAQEKAVWVAALSPAKDTGG